jgi:hypothetical protein
MVYVGSRDGLYSVDPDGNVRHVFITVNWFDKMYQEMYEFVGPLTTPLVLAQTKNVGRQASVEVEVAAVNSNQHFFCNTGYTPKTCHDQLTVLKSVVAKYSSRALGEWTWVLVKSQGWQPLTKMLNLNPDSPAFTCLEKRETFIEEALVAKVSGRNAALLARWHMGMRDLLDYAVMHEVGHGLCNSLNEDKANHIANQLKRGQSLTCETDLWSFRQSPSRSFSRKR